MLNENLWNEPKRLSPKFQKFSADNIVFKKRPRDLEFVKKQERKDKFSSEMAHVLCSKQEANERH